MVKFSWCRRQCEVIGTLGPPRVAVQVRLSYVITLTVHSDLHAVGLLAAIATRLAAHGISLNVVSAYFHDHLFVPVERAQEALEVLREFVSEQR